jgi:hypothetical protein
MDTEGYVVLRNVLGTQTLEIFKIQTKMVENIECFKINEKLQSYPFGDRQCKNSFSKYGILCYESLLLLLQPLMEKYIGRELSPTYSYTRIYYKNSKLDKHIDRKSCEYTASICITIDNEPWDIYLKKYDSTEACVSLNPGDLIIFKGTELEHWREKYNGNEQIQVFLHYIDKNGPYNNPNYVNDGRPIIGIEKSKIL